MRNLTIKCYKNETHYYAAIPHDDRCIVCPIMITPALSLIIEDLRKWSHEAGYNYILDVVDITK